MKSSKPILIEALTLENDSGLGKINRMLLAGLEKCLEKENVILISRKGAPSLAHKTHVTWKHLKVSAKPLRLWMQVLFPLTLLKYKPQLILCLGINIPKVRFGIPYWLLVCDVGPLENLPFRTSKFDEENKKRFPAIIKGANCILTISEFSKNRIHTTTGYPSQNIEVFKPIGPESTSFTMNPETPLEGSQALPETPFIFCHGNLEPRKNHLNLIRAYALAQKRNPALPPLFIAGHKAWGYSAIKDEIKKTGLQEKVHLLGYLPGEQIKQFMQKCLVYINCSLYEGWGFPLFEALEMKKPCIFHLESSQKEFAEHFALGIDCHQPEDIAQALNQLIESESSRQQLIEKLQDFTEGQTYDLVARLREIFISREKLS